MFVADHAVQVARAQDRDVEQRADVVRAQVIAQVRRARVGRGVVDGDRAQLGGADRSYVARTGGDRQDHALGRRPRGQLEAAHEVGAALVEEPDAGARDLERLARQARDVGEQARQHVPAVERVTERVAQQGRVRAQAQRQAAVAREARAIVALAVARCLELPVDQYVVRRHLPSQERNRNRNRTSADAGGPPRWGRRRACTGIPVGHEFSSPAQQTPAAGLRRRRAAGSRLDGLLGSRLDGLLGSRLDGLLGSRADDGESGRLVTVYRRRARSSNARAG